TEAEEWVGEYKLNVDMNRDKGHSVAEVWKDLIYGSWLTLDHLDVDNIMQVPTMDLRVKSGEFDDVDVQLITDYLSFGRSAQDLKNLVSKLLERHPTYQFYHFDWIIDVLAARLKKIKFPSGSKKDFTLEALKSYSLRLFNAFWSNYAGGDKLNLADGQLEQIQ